MNGREMHEQLGYALRAISDPVQVPSGTLRPLAIMTEYGRRYPHAWKQAAKLRAAKGSPQLGNWPNWCFLPMAGAAAIVCSVGSLSPSQVPEVAPLAALIDWRMTKGIYRFDRDVLQEIFKTPLDKDLPIELLFRAPEWCVYVEMPENGVLEGAPAASYERLRGFFAHLEWDVNAKHAELRFLLDYEQGLAAHMVNLTRPTLEQCLVDTFEEGIDIAGTSLSKLPDRALVDEGSRAYAELLAPLVSTYLYLCSTNPEIYAADGSDSLPGNPVPRRTKKHSREIFAAKGVGEWNVAWRFGAALRTARSRSSTVGTGTGTRKRPHIRKAHWHTYWTGPRAPERSAERELVLRWIPPVAVNVGGEDEMPAVIRPVE